MADASNVKIPKSVLTRLAKQKVENEELFGQSINAMAGMFFVPAFDIEFAKKELLRRVEEAGKTGENAVRDARAADLAVTMNQYSNIILFLKEGDNYVEVGNVFNWMSDVLSQCFEEKMTPIFRAVDEKVTDAESGEEVTNRIVNFGVVAKRQRGARSSINRSLGGSGRFRPDLITYLNGQTLDRPATKILRDDMFTNSEAGINQRAVDNGTAKGARSAVFLGLADDAHESLPIFRAWIYKRVDGKPVFEDGKPVYQEIDALASQYIDDLALNKNKSANEKLGHIRKEYSQPIVGADEISKAIVEMNKSENKSESESRPAAPVIPPIPTISLGSVSEDSVEEDEDDNDFTFSDEGELEPDEVQV